MLGRVKSLARRAIIVTPVLRGYYLDCVCKKLNVKQLTGGGKSPLQLSLDTFLTPEQQNDKAYMKRLLRDITLCQVLYNAKPEEYFIYHFEGMPHKLRKTYALDNIKDGLLIKYIGLDNFDILKDKYRFYTHMKEFYKRDVISVKTSEDIDKFNSFVAKHRRFIVKPIRGARGQNTDIWEITDSDSNRTFQRLLSIDGGAVIEELIHQSAEMAKFNPSSVNTVRLPAFLNKKGWQAWRPFFRTGRAGSVVDNAGAGGIIVALDEKTGKFLGKAADEKCRFYTNHPDSGLSLIDGCVPKWNELLEFAEEVHRCVPEQKYVGWDFALTDNGWVLVEGNWGQPVWQIPMQQGVLPEFVAHLTDKD